jgi:hypothetical protein
MYIYVLKFVKQRDKIAKKRGNLEMKTAEELFEMVKSLENGERWKFLLLM